MAGGVAAKNDVSGISLEMTRMITRKALTLFLLVVYIVYLGRNQFQDTLLTITHHVKFLSTVFTSNKEAKESVLYSYKHSFLGFSALLNSTQATALSGRELQCQTNKSYTGRFN